MPASVQPLKFAWVVQQARDHSAQCTLCLQLRATPAAAATAAAAAAAAAPLLLLLLLLLLSIMPSQGFKARLPAALAAT
jgi:hypothetical protein